MGILHSSTRRNKTGGNGLSRSALEGKRSTILLGKKNPKRRGDGKDRRRTKRRRRDRKVLRENPQLETIGGESRYNDAAKGDRVFTSERAWRRSYKGWRSGIYPSGWIRE